MAATSFSGVSRTGARRSLGATSPFAATEPGGFATCETACSPVIAIMAMARILPKTTQLKKPARFILEPVYRFGCSGQVAFPSHTGHRESPPVIWPGYSDKFLPDKSEHQVGLTNDR